MLIGLLSLRASDVAHIDKRVCVKRESMAGCWNKVSCVSPELSFLSVPLQTGQQLH